MVGIELVELPEAGLVDAIRSEPAFRRQLLTQVGYGQVGVTHGGGPPQQIYPNIRKYASGWVRLEKGKPTGLDVDYLFRTAHPGGPGDDGGTGCFGDSGGSFFLGDAASNQQVGVFSGTGAVGPDGILCRAENFAFRLDTATARAFLCGQEIAAACETGATVAQDNTVPIVSKKTAKESVTKKAAKDKQGKLGKQGKRGDQKHHDKHKARRR